MEEAMDRRILFCAALFGISKEDLRISSGRWAINTLPIRFLEFFRTRLTTEGRTEGVIRRARNCSIKINESLPLCGVRKISEAQQRKLILALLKYEWKTNHLIINSKLVSFPLHLSLAKLTDGFILEWNDLVRKVQGQWLLHYGTITPNDLKIRDISEVIVLLDHPLHVKVLKGRISHSDYLQKKITAKVVSNHLKLNKSFKTIGNRSLSVE